MFTHELMLKEGDPLKEFMGNITLTFDCLIDFLRNDFPNPAINDLCSLAWKLIGNQVVQVAVGIPVPTNFAFALVGKPTLYQPIVAIREDWLPFVKSNRTMGLGAICFVASQCRDYWNGKIIGFTEESNARSIMYEAEMLLTLMQHEEFKPNEWQKEALAKFPHGIQSGKQLLYLPRKPFMNAS